MNSVMRNGTLAFAALWALACGGDQAPSADQLAGTWQASKIVYASSSGLGTVDIVANGGSATLVLGADKSLRFTLTQPGGANGTLTGTYAMDGIDLMSVTQSGGVGNFPWAFSLSGDVMQLSCGPGTGTGTSDNCAFVLDPGMEIGFDFDADGALESATWTLTLHK